MQLECLDCGYDFESYDVIATINRTYDAGYNQLNFRCPQCDAINYCTFKEINKKIVE